MCPSTIMLLQLLSLATYIGKKITTTVSTVIANETKQVFSEPSKEKRHPSPRVSAIQGPLSMNGDYVKFVIPQCMEGQHFNHYILSQHQYADKHLADG